MHLQLYGTTIMKSIALNHQTASLTNVMSDEKSNNILQRQRNIYVVACRIQITPVAPLRTRFNWNQDMGK